MAIGVCSLGSSLTNAMFHPCFMQALRREVLSSCANQAAAMMFSRARMLLAMVTLALHSDAQIADRDPSQLGPCSITIERVLTLARWEAIGTPGAEESKLLCTPNGAIHTFIVPDRKLVGNLSGFTQFMKDLRWLDITSNHITGE